MQACNAQKRQVPQGVAGLAVDFDQVSDPAEVEFSFAEKPADDCFAFQSTALL